MPLSHWLGVGWLSLSSLGDWEVGGEPALLSPGSGPGPRRGAEGWDGGLLGSFTSAWLALGLSRVEVLFRGHSAPGRVGRVVLLAPDFVDTLGHLALCSVMPLSSRTGWCGMGSWESPSPSCSPFCLFPGEGFPSVIEPMHLCGVVAENLTSDSSSTT